MTTTIVDRQQNPGCLLQILWFALIGWWLGQIWTAIAWIFMVTIIGLPVGIAMIERLPKIVALRGPVERVAVTRRAEGGVVRREIEIQQVNFLLRALYFIVVGWWLSALWMEAAYAICATVIGLPLGFWMFDRVPTVLTLRHS
jgi:uncharacterized membrane protein YccF (DUF307 family)